MNRPSLTRAPRAPAFTLIEMLMAAAAGALILAVLVTVYGRAIRVRNQANEHTRASRLEARAATILRSDLRSGHLTSAGVATGLLAATLDTGSSTSHSRFPGGLRLDTTSGLIDEDHFASDLLEVEYYIADDPSSSSDGKSGALKRSVMHALPGSTFEVEREETILTGVEAMDVAFFDGSDWQPSWQITPPDHIHPSAIRVRLTLNAEAHPGSTRRTIEVMAAWTTEPSIP